MRRILRWALPAVLVTSAAVPVLGIAAGPADALENGLARTPQLGWNDWNSFGCNVTDNLIRQTADAMVSSGMAAAGYKYVNIDDCWSEKSRDGSGNLVPDHVKFPNGIKAVADYVHGKGLKLGIYSSAGQTTCAGYPASLGNEQRDANTWASWGIDYLKYDNCGQTNGISGPTRYATMRDALSRTGRAILFAICNWGTDNVISWGASTGNSWRTTGDIGPSWASMTGNLDAQPAYAGVSKPGAWNDPDMLEVGHGLTDTESRAHFSLWALLNAPLIAGNDLRTMSATTASILTNTDVIAVNQDWGGRQGNRLSRNGTSEIWTKPMADGSVAVVLLNRGSSTTTISTSAPAVGLASASSYSARDLWAHTTSTTSGTLSASVPSHGAAMYVVSRTGSTPSPTTTSPSPTTTTPSPSTTPSPTTTTPTPTPTTTPTGTCRVSAVVNAWNTGLTEQITLTNTGSATVNGWSLTFTLPGGQTITSGWNAVYTPSSGNVTAKNADYNAVIAPGTSASIGFQATHTGNTAAPTGFTLNGSPCTTA